MIVDTDRSFERECGMDPIISLKNIWRVRIITGEGKLLTANAENLEEATRRALDGAGWNVDPAGFPPNIKPAWLAIEFGDYASASRSLKKSLRSSNRETKAAAKTLKEYVQATLDKELQSADEALAAGNKWQAYQTLLTIPRRFKGYAVPPEVRKKAKELATDDAIKAERVALKKVRAARKALNSRSPRGRKRATANLEKLIAKSPDSQAAKEAQELLDELNKPQEANAEESSRKISGQP